MSTSERPRDKTDFDRWLTDEFSRSGSFTVLAVLVHISETKVDPLCSTYLNVIGDEIDWDEIVVLFHGAGMEWDGAAFFPLTAPGGGPLDNPTARLRLRELEARLNDNRLVLNEGEFFDKWGRRLKIEEIALQ